MRTEGDALLADVIAHPLDDGLRLVYADWLEEKGGQPERAEAIRLGVERRRLDDLAPRAWVIDTRAERLQQRYCKKWEAGLPKLEGVEFFLGTEGFVDHVSIYAPGILCGYEDAIFGAGPITHLEFHFDDPPDIAFLTGCPYLDRLRTLDIWAGEPEKFEFAWLVNCPGLAGLRHLDLNSCYLQNDFLVRVAHCPRWPSLESLNLHRNPFGLRGLRALASAPLLGTLRSLNLSQAVSSPRGFEELVHSPYLGNLRKFEVPECGLVTRNIRRMAERDWPALEVLNLAMNGLGRDGLSDLVNAPGLARLRELDLGGTPSLADNGAVVLAAATQLSNLRSLIFDSCRVGRRGLNALGQASWLRNLTRLGLAEPEVSRFGIDVLVNAPLDNLRWLSLMYSDLDDNCIRRLLTAPWIAQLTHLDLSNNAIGAAGARALAESPHLDNLVDLDLRQNQVPSKAARILRDRFGDRVIVKRDRD
jgi:uncharacterized protein (TIGR02996 family)